METVIVLVIVLLILVVAAVVFMNMNTNKNTEAIMEAQEKINKLKNSIAETKLKTSRSEPDKVKRVKIDEKEPEDDIVYLKSAAAMDVQSPDIEKNNFPMQSDEVRASGMESQNIVENDAKKNFEESDAKIDPRVMNEGSKSLEFSRATKEKLAAAGRKVKDKERTHVINKELEAAGGKVQKAPKALKGPSPELIRLGPPNMIKPAVCRQIPGSSVDSCGRPSSIGELIRLGPPNMIKPAVCRDIPGSSVDSCGRPSSTGGLISKATFVQV